MKSTKAYVLGALIITLSIIIIGGSLSYAYFMNSVVETNSANKGVNVTSGELTMNFSTSQTISATAAMLIDDTDADFATKASHTDFYIELPSNAKVGQATYNLYLTDITMTNNFKNADVKWALYSAPTNTDGTVGDYTLVTGATGSFADINLTVSDTDTTACADYTSGATPVSCRGDNVSLITNVAITPGTKTNYKLYIWLSNATDRNQTDLLEGTLSAKVAFKAVSTPTQS